MEAIVNDSLEIKKISDLYDIASIVANNPLQYESVRILVIDDNFDSITESFEEIIKFLPEESEIYITKNNEWENEFLKDASKFWVKMYEKQAELYLIKIIYENDKLIKSQEPYKFFTNKKFNYDYIVIDLLLGKYNEGNKIINNFEIFRNNFNRLNDKSKTYFDIITLSLSEETHDISRALNEGSLFYIPKKRPYMIPAVIAQLEKSRRTLKERVDKLKTLQKSRNFGKLYKLPESIKRNLQIEPFLDLLDVTQHSDGCQEVPNSINDRNKNTMKEWIKNMPKADLHCHLGGSMDGNLAFYLSLNMLIPPEEIVDNKEYNKKIGSCINKIMELINAILDKEKDINKLFIKFGIAYSILTKFTEDELEAKKKDKLIEHLEDIKKITKNTNIVDGYKHYIQKIEKGKIKEIKKWIKNIKGKSDNYFDDILSNQKKKKVVVIEEIFFDILNKIVKKTFSNNNSPKAVNIFNVLIGIIEGKTSDDVGPFWDTKGEIINPPESGKNDKEKTKIYKKNISEIQSKLRIRELNEIKVSNKDLLDKLIKEINNIDDLKGKSILKQFISAKRRKTKSLAEYLGGCKFTGSEQLQKKENIIAALFDIIEKNVKDNVRLLELKLSPDGYINDHLTMQEAVQTVFLGTDLITLYFYNQGKYIHVNYIFTVKRHKTPEEAALEVSSAVANRDREKYYRDIIPIINQKNVPILKYEWTPAKVVGVDLAGLEKGNPAKNFVNDFYPLFKTCSFITIHAGEDDTAQSIWEAIYLLHANRIGHGLTLNEKWYLKEMFKNLQICIELNPISNMLTNPDIEKKYPFFDFVLEGLNITVNTDNPAVSESTLSDEFVKAAEFFQFSENNKENHWISKWGILKIIKNSFSSAFMDREEKRKLIRAVEEEIYEKIIKEYGI